MAEQLTWPTFYTKLQAKGLPAPEILKAWQQYSRTGQIPSWVAAKVSPSYNDYTKAGSNSFNIYQAPQTSQAPKTVPTTPKAVSSPTPSSSSSSLSPMSRINPFVQWAIGGDVNNAFKDATGGQGIYPDEVSKPAVPNAAAAPAATPVPTAPAVTNPYDWNPYEVTGALDRPDLGLDAILARINAGGQIADPAVYQQRAQELATQAYAPQRAAIDLSAKTAQDRYNRADPMIAAMYDKLQASLQEQANNTGQVYGTRQAVRQKEGDELSSKIGQTYQNNNQAQAQMLKEMGLEAALPGLQNDESAYRQQQAQQNTLAQSDWIGAIGSNQQDYQNSVNSATGAQGVVERQNLIAKLAEVMAGLDQKRTDVAGEQTQYAQSLASQLSSAGSSQAQQQLQNEIQGYELKTKQDQNDYDRAVQAIDRAVQAIDYRAKLSGGLPVLDFKDRAQLDQANIKLKSAYGDVGERALNIAMQVGSAIKSGGTNYKDAGSFINEVVNRAQGEGGIKNQAATLSAAYEVLKILDLKGTGVQ